MRPSVPIACLAGLLALAASIPAVLALPGGASPPPAERPDAFACTLERVDPDSDFHVSSDAGLISLDVRRFASNPRAVGVRTVLRVYRGEEPCCGDADGRELVHEFVSDPVLVPGGVPLDDVFPLVVPVPPGRYLAQVELESDYGFPGREWSAVAADFLSVIVPR